MSRVLVFGDTHIPFMLKKYSEFLKEVYKKYKCDKVVCMGDLFDCHAISRHDTHPDAVGGKEEYLRGIKQAKQLYKFFPKVEICIGNHDEILYRQNATLGIPEIMLPTLKTLFQTPIGWKWAYQHTIDGINYFHGTGISGEHAHVTATKKKMMSTCIGHIHTNLGVRYIANDRELLLSIGTGCGMNHRSYAAAYAKFNIKKPVIGCVVVIDGTLVIPVPMNLGTRIVVKR